MLFSKHLYAGFVYQNIMVKLPAMLRGDPAMYAALP
jgi:hypothetical protein